MSNPKLALIPSGYKSGKVYSILPNDASGDFDFTRQSIGTRVRKDGLIEEAKTVGSITNLQIRSEEFDNSAWIKSDISVTANDTLAPNGTNTADAIVEGTGTGGKIIYDTHTTTTGVYTFSIYIKKEDKRYTSLQVSGTAFGMFNVDLDNGTGEVVAGSFDETNIEVLANDWYRISVTFTATSGTLNNQIYLMNGSAYANRNYTGNGTDKNYVWGAMVSDGALSDYIKTEGTTETKTVETFTDVPRLDWLNSNCPSLKLEPQRSNNLKYSEDFSNAVWGLLSAGTGVNPIVTANYSIAPNGTLTADRVIFNQGSGTSSSDYSIIRQVVTSVGQGISSVYMKSNTDNNYIIGIDEVGLGTKDVTVTPDWQRFEYSETTNDRLQLSLRGGTNSNYADISVWGAMLEQGDYPTSYIKTEASTVTRLKDEIFAEDSNLFDITEGTFFVDATPFKSGGGMEIQLSDGTASNRHTIQYQGTGTSVRALTVTGGTTVFSDFNPLTFDIRNKLAITFKKDEFKFYVNGSLVHTDLLGDVPTGLDKLTFSNPNLTGNFMEGKIHDTRVYDRVLTEAEAIELTT